MKKLVFISLLALAACGEKTAQQNQKIKGEEIPMAKSEKLQVDVSKLALNIDPVCEMPVTGGVADTASYKGKLYGFCNTGCKEEFVKKPTDYVK